MKAYYQGELSAHLNTKKLPDQKYAEMGPDLELERNESIMIHCPDGEIIMLYHMEPYGTSISVWQDKDSNPIVTADISRTFRKVPT